MKNKDIGIICLVYFMAHGLILFNKGIYWDDWILTSDPKTVSDYFKQVGVTGWGHFNNFLHALPCSMFWYRALAFLSYLLAAFPLNGVLKTVKEIHPVSRLFLVLFFCTFPVNHARTAMINAPPALNYLLFYFAFWMTSQYLFTQRIVLRVMALLFFFLSFFTNSVVFFYSIVIFYLMYMEKQRCRSLGSIFFRYSDFVLLPIVFWIIKMKYFVPYGMFEGHNHVGLKGIIKAIFLSPLPFYTSFFDVLDASLQSLSSASLLFAVVFGLFVCGRCAHWRGGRPAQDEVHPWLFAAGLFIFWLAAFPYIAVGKVPVLRALESRHQLLLPLGASFILYYGLKILFTKLTVPHRGQIFICSLFVGLFIHQNINNYIAYEKDWYKQVSLIENFKRSKVMKTHTSFLFKDYTLDLNVSDRLFSFYEYTGLMKSAFGDEKRLGVNPMATAQLNADNLPYYIKWNMKDYKLKDFEYKITIQHGEYILSKNKVLKLMYLEIFKQEDFKKLVRFITDLEFEKMNPTPQ